MRPSGTKYDWTKDKRFIQGSIIVVLEKGLNWIDRNFSGNAEVAYNFINNFVKYSTKDKNINDDVFNELVNTLAERTDKPLAIVLYKIPKFMDCIDFYKAFEFLSIFDSSIKFRLTKISHKFSNEFKELESKKLMQFLSNEEQREIKRERLKWEKEVEESGIREKVEREMMQKEIDYVLYR